MNDQELRDEGAIEYASDILEGLEQLAEIAGRKESVVIKKVISSIEVMVQHDFNLTVQKLDS